MYSPYNNVNISTSFMYRTAWKKKPRRNTCCWRRRSESFRAIDTADGLIHYQEAPVGEALNSLDQQGSSGTPCFFRPSLLQPGARTIGRPTIPRRSHDTGSAVLCQLIGSPGHRLCGLLCFTRAFFAAGFGRSGLGSLVGDGSALSIRENQNDRRQQHHGRATHRAMRTGES